MEHSHTTNTVADTATGLMDRVRERAAAQLSTQKDRATDGLGSVAEAVRHSTRHLRENKQEAIAGYVEKAADQIDRFSAQLRDRDVSEIVDDVQRFARRQPAIFVASAFALGIVGARFLKSSPARGSRDRWLASGTAPHGLDYAGRGM